MKKINLFKFVWTFVLLLFLSISSHARDIYLSPDGLDTNSGDLGAPFKTFSRAISVAKDLDVIRVSGMIKIKEEPVNSSSDDNKNGDHILPDGSSSYKDPETKVVYNTWNATGNNGIRMLSKKLTIIGENNTTSGFDGEGATRLFKFYDVGKKIVFKNLTFKRGCSDPNDEQGAGFFIRNTIPPDFEKCIFSGNKNTVKQDGGAIFYDAQRADQTALFHQCIFRDNASVNGGDIHILSGNIQLTECLMENNTLENGGRGGSLFVKLNQERDINLLVKRSVIQNNFAPGHGGALFYEDSGEGNYQCNITLEACALLSNTSHDRGGALFIDNKTQGRTLNLSLINTTIYNNTSGNDGGGLIINRGEKGSELTIINCTITQNKAGNEEHGGGIKFMDDENFSSQKMVKKIYNTIIENNTSPGNLRSDLSIQTYTATTQDLIMDRSFVGVGRGTFSATNYQNENKINYDNGTEKPANIYQPSNAVVELYKAIPLQYGSDNASKSEGIGYGKAKYLQDRSIHFDQIGKWRSFKGGICNIGAVEVGIGEMAPTGSDWIEK
jgi:hypothetical protein